jgi:hypothetical protein
VVFEGPARLLDWGVQSCASPTTGLPVVVAKRVRPLLLRYRPFAVVMRYDNQHSLRTAERIRTSIDAISREAHRHGVEIRLVKTKSRNQFFIQLRRNAKHQVATLIADLFEELSLMVRPERKAWHSESYHTVIFDAAATGLVAFANDFYPDGVRELVGRHISWAGPHSDAATLRAVIHGGGRPKRSGQAERNGQVH